eukprot:scaffold22777_cov67-Phaeocystis_antarctica.AAC.2
MAPGSQTLRRRGIAERCAVDQPFPSGVARRGCRVEQQQGDLSQRGLRRWRHRLECQSPLPLRST